MVAINQVSNSTPIDIYKSESTDISRPAGWNSDKALAAKFVQQEAKKKAAELLAKSKQRKKKEGEQFVLALAAPVTANSTPVQVKGLHVAWQKNVPHQGGLLHHPEAMPYQTLATDKTNPKSVDQTASSGKKNLNQAAQVVTEPEKGLNTATVQSRLNSLHMEGNGRQLSSEAKPASARVPDAYFLAEEYNMTVFDQRLSPKMAQFSIPVVSVAREMQAMRSTSGAESAPDLSGAKGDVELSHPVRDEISTVASTSGVESAPDLSGAKGYVEPSTSAGGDISATESMPLLMPSGDKDSSSGDERPLVLVNQPISVSGPVVTQHEELHSPSWKSTETPSGPAPAPSGAIGGVNSGGRTLSYTFTQWRNSPVVTFDLSRTGKLGAVTNSAEVQQALLESRHWLASENQLHFHEEGRDEDHSGQQQSEQEDES